MQYSPTFTMDVRPEGPDVTAAVRGDVDISNSVELALRLEGAARQAGGGSLTVDLCDTRYLDSSGLRALVTVRNAHPTMRLVVRSGTLVARVIDVSGLKDIFDVRRVTAQ